MIGEFPSWSWPSVFGDEYYQFLASRGRKEASWENKMLVKRWNEFSRWWWKAQEETTRYKDVLGRGISQNKNPHWSLHPSKIKILETKK